MTSEIGLELPEILPIMPSHEGVVFPYTIVPRTVTSEHAIQLIDDAVNGFKMIGLCAVRPGDDHLPQPGPDSIFRIGTVTGIDRLYRFPGNIVRLHLRGLARFRIVEFIDSDRPYLLARIERLNTEFPSRGPEMDAWRNTVELQMKQVLELSPGVADDSQLMDLARDPERLGFVAAGRIDASVEDRQAILEENDIVRRLRLLSGIMAQEIKVLRLRNKIQGQVRAEIEKDQKEYILKEQMKAIQKELGGEGENPEVDELRERLEEKELPDPVRETAEEELDRLSKMHPGLPEVAVIRTYIDWILCLPWLDITTDRLDIGAARDVLEADHYDLKEVKERILEFIAVRKLNPAGKAPILCFVGPPGVGKTSMGRSIARAMGRKFVRLSLGGVHDEAEIRGHRKTYIGAMPGKIIQGLKEAGSSNPVFMLDEVDKIGNDFRGDPTSALLEVLDPEQNYSFRDNYINVPFDLSRVQFITTANRLDTIPPPLKDRMEIVRIPGYTSGEKLEIAGRYLVSRQRGNAGLTGAGIRFTRKGIEDIISSYTREAGVRELERQIGRICRKVAMRFADGDPRLVVVGRSSLHGFLGPKRYTTEKTYAEPRVGVVAGLAWTPTGGEILLIEAMVMKGKGSLVLTGQLGDVMKESATAALSWIRHHAADYGITGDFGERDIHVHVPAGATPKDGPSAGVAMLLSILSALTAKPVRHDVAVTGEISLQGRVMPVGGIKEKALGALAAGITTVIIPEENLRDLEEVPENIRGMMVFEHVRDVWTVIPRMIEGLKGVVE